MPAIFYWKGVIEPGTSDHLMMSMDVFPTIADLFDLEIDQKALSGQSAAQWLREGEQNTQSERFVFWRFKDQKAVRQGKWKLLIHNGKTSLFDLEEDKQETNDLKKEFPDIFHELEQALKDWEANLKEEIRA